MPLAASGEVTLLVQRDDTQEQLVERFRIDPAYLPVLLDAAEAGVLPSYVQPPPCAYVLASMTSRPPMKGRSAAGITTEPSFCW